MVAEQGRGLTRRPASWKSASGRFLTQNTNWSNVEKALANLHDAGAMSVEGLHKMSQEQLAELIRPAGYFNVKAKRLGNFIREVYENWGEDISAFLDRPVYTLREELLAINGIGRETADSMILYAAGLPTFVVDAYTARIFTRHGLLSREDDYESIKEFFESNLPDNVELWNDFHAQIVAVGKNFCKPTPKKSGMDILSMRITDVSSVEKTQKITKQGQDVPVTHGRDAHARAGPGQDDEAVPEARRLGHVRLTRKWNSTTRSSTRSATSLSKPCRLM